MTAVSSISIGYYPGCSGLGTSMEYDGSTREVCRVLGIVLNDIPDWSCCGSTPAHTIDHALSTALAARNLAQAETVGISDMVTPCPSCLKNMRNAIHHLEDPIFRARVDALTERPLQKQHTARSVLQVIVEDLGLDVVKAKVKNPLTGLKVVPYYGCLMNRPAEAMQFDSAEYPMAMDNLLEALGAEVIPFPLKVDCCGASFAIPGRDVIPRLTGRILEQAAGLGADAIVVACPLCQMNLDLRQGQVNRANGTSYNIPVPYFTQLMAYAFGSSDKVIGFNKLNINIKPAFDSMRGRAAEIARQQKEAAEKAAAKAAKAKPAAKAEGKDASAGGEK